eukprot:jgi/Galph1/21/GphlegSOOS_G4810.1
MARHRRVTPKHVSRSKKSSYKEEEHLPSEDEIDQFTKQKLDRLERSFGSFDDHSTSASISSSEQEFEDEMENTHLAASDSAESDQDSTESFDELEEEGISEEEEEDSRWGQTTQGYYGADTVDVENLEGDVEQVLKEEEEEARRLQEKQFSMLLPEDFGTEDTVQATITTNDELSQQGKWSQLTEEEKMRIIEKDSPELLKLQQEFQEKVEELFSYLKPTLDDMKKHKKDANWKGLNFLELKYHVLLNYCIHISFFMLLKAKGISVKDHPVIDQLIELRVVMEKMKTLEDKLQYQIRKLTDAARTEENQSASQSIANDNLQNKWKPNPSALVPLHEEDSEDEENDESITVEEQTQVYRPPRIAPVVDPMEKKKKHAHQVYDESERQHVEVSKENLRDSYMEMEDLPDEMRQGFGVQSPERRQQLMKEEKERQKFEEDNFMRLFTGKKEQKIQRKAYNGSDDTTGISEFGHDFDKLVSMADEIDQSFRATSPKAKFDEQEENMEQGSISSEEEVNRDDSSESEIEDDLQYSKGHTKSTNIPLSGIPHTLPKGMRRKADKKMLENRGLTRRRKKETKNPRLKHRKRFYSAQKRRKGVTPNASNLVSRYQGESSEIEMLRSAKELQPSKVMFIKEIVEQGKQLIGFAVRLVGRAVIYDPTKDILVLEYQGFRLLVSTAFISSFDYRCGRLFQCIGEVSPCDLTDKLFHCASC